MTMFKKGNRIRYSRLGVERLQPKKPDRLGTIAKDQKYIDQVRVYWDGLKANGSESYHPDFIELASTTEPELAAQEAPVQNLRQG